MLTFGNVNGTDFVYAETATTALSITVPLMPLAAGDKIAVIAYNKGNGTTSQFAIPADYTAISNDVDARGALGFFCKISDGTETSLTLTIPTLAQVLSVLLLRIRGSDTAQMVNAFIPGSAPGGSNYTTPSLTTTADGCLVFAMAFANGTSDWLTGDEPDEMTLVYQEATTASWMGCAYESQATAGATGTRSWTNAVNAKRTLTFAFAPAPSGTTINATTQALTISTPPATVQAGIDTNITAAAEALTLSGQVAQVASDRAITAQAVQLGISSQAALVSRQTDIATSAAQLAMSANVAQVASDRLVAAQAAQITLTSPDAAVTLLAEILAGTEQIGISGQQADIAIGIHAQAESITLLGLVSAITADRTLAATVASISVSPAPATVTLGAAIPAATEVLRLDTLPSSVRLDVAVHGSVLAIALSELSATIGLARHLDAEVASLTITPQGAEIELASGVRAQVASLTLEAFAATIEAAAPGNLPPGLQFTLPDNRMQYRMPVNRIHFSFRRS